MKKSLEKWLYGLVAAFIGGGASAVVAGLTVATIDPEKFNPLTQTVHFIEVAAAMFLVNGFMSMMFYLKQSPLPAQTDTTFLNKPASTDASKDTNMKAPLIAILLTLSVCLSSQAQISLTNAPNFFTQSAVWGTSFNTNSDHNWNTTQLQVDTGIATTTGINVADRINAQYDIGPVGLGAVGQFTGVGSAFSELEGSFQYNLIQKYDFKLGPVVNAGYDFNKQDKSGQRAGAIAVEPGLFAAKVMTWNTYAHMEWVFPIESRGRFNPLGLFYFGFGARF